MSLMMTLYEEEILLNSLYRKSFLSLHEHLRGSASSDFGFSFLFFCWKGTVMFFLFMKSYDLFFFFKKVNPCMLYKGKILLFLWMLFSFKKWFLKTFLLFFNKKCSKYRMFLSFFIFFCITPLPNSAGGVEYSSLSPWETLGERAWRPERKSEIPLDGGLRKR